MKTYSEVMNSGLVYAMVIVILAVVAVMCVVFFLKSRKQALKLGVTQEEIKNVCKSSLVLTIVPSIAIVVGLFALSAMVGLPWAQLRLSVIGAVMYELFSAQMGLSAMGFSDVSAAYASSASTFGTVMFVMSAGIILGPIVNTIVSKPLGNGLRKAGSSSQFSPVMNNCFMIAMFAVLIPVYVAKGTVTIAVLLTSALCSFLIGWIAKKTGAQWLSEFNLSLCLLIGMASSVLWTNVFA